MIHTVRIPLKLIGLNGYTDKNRSNKYEANDYKQELERVIMLFIRKLPQIEKPVLINLIWIEENKKRDPDNISSAKKFILDALVKSKKLPGDGHRWVVGFQDDFDFDEEAAIIIEFEEVSFMTIKEYLKTHNLTIRQLADKSNVGESTISRILNYETNDLSPQNRVKLKRLGIEVPQTKKRKKRHHNGAWRDNAPKGSVAEYLIKNKMKLSELSRLSGVSSATLTGHVNGKTNLAPTNRQKLAALGINYFDIKPPTAKSPRIIKDDETVVAETIEYIIEEKNGIAYAFNKNQKNELIEWLESRNYKFVCKKVRKNDYEIHFKKIDKEGKKND